MTIREQETLLQALDLWRKAVGEMSGEARAEAALALLMVRDDELEELRRRIPAGRDPVIDRSRAIHTLLEAGIDDARQAAYQWKISTLLGRGKERT